MWRFAAARATGSSHLRVGLPCQDRLACTILLDGTLVAAMADGAGSAPMGDIGAEIAVNAIIDRLRCTLLDDEADRAVLLREAAVRARESVLSEAKRREVDPRTLASTLLVLVVAASGATGLQIGDGVMVVSDGTDEWSWVFWPQRGEYANTTFFLTDDDAIERLEVESLPGTIMDAALLTDGLEPLSLDYSRRTVHDPFFRGMIRPLHESESAAEVAQLSALLEQFLSSDRVRARTDDDVSLILATRRERTRLE